MSTDLSKLEGVELAGRFVLRKLLGRGGYGAVFDAEQTSMGRRCAVKVLAPQNGETDRVVARFKVEARATSRLNHPNTVVIYDFGQDEEHDVLFLAMEYLSGQDLRSLIEAGPLSPAEAVHITRQMAASLDDAHVNGIVHRDVKPHNVMITHRGKDRRYVKVIDFGIAKAMTGSVRTTMQQLTMSGAIVGTPAYMSPEQVRDGAVDGRSDQYSLAICLYAMLTGQPPYRGSSPIDVATRHLTDTPKSLRTMNPRLLVTDGFEAVVARALSRTPDQRYDTCSAFAEALEAAFKDGGGDTVSLEIDAETTAPLKVHTPAAFAQTAETERPDDVMTSAPPTHQLPKHISQSGNETTEEELREPVQPRVTGAIAPSAAPTEEPQLQIAVTHDGDLPDTPGFTQPLGANSEPANLVKPIESRPQKRGPSKAMWIIPIVALVAVVGLGLAKFGGAGAGAEQTAKAEPRPDPVLEVSQPTLEQVPKDEEIAVAEPEPGPEPPVADSIKEDAKPAAIVAKTRPEVESPPEEEPDKPDERPAASTKAKVQVYVRPWGDLYVDGRKQGNKIRYEMKLKAGKHRFELRQSGATKVSKTVDVESGQTTIVKLRADTSQ